MNVIDAVIVIMIAAIVVIETKRGFGRVIFDFAALFAAARAASIAAPTAAGAVHLAKDAPANEAIWLAMLFVILGCALVYVGKVAYDHTQISLDLFDPMFGGVAGVGVAVTVAHVLLCALAISSNVGVSPPEVLAGSTLGMEFYRFGAYHQMMHFLYTFGA